MTAIESKEEISDTDSGIILHSGKKTTTIQHLIPICTVYRLGMHNQYKWSIII